MNQDSLTPQQEGFASSVASGVNESEAYRLHYHAENMLATSIHVEASTLAHNPKVARRITELRESIRVLAQDKFKIHAESVLKELVSIGFSNMGDFASWSDDGVTLINSEMLTPDKMAAVSEISQTVTKDGGSVKFKLHDKLGALEKLGKYLGLFVDRSEINITHTLKPGMGLEELEARVSRLNALEAGVVDGTGKVTLESDDTLHSDPYLDTQDSSQDSKDA